MVAKFEKLSVSDALERSIRNAKHLTARDSAAVAAARALAGKIDAWDQIVEWAVEDVEDVEGKRGARPAVPQNDNTSIPTFLKYCAALGLLPEVEETSVKKKSVAQTDMLSDFRKKHKVV